ncbi:MAG: hypothetical protein F4Y42_05350 [Caldilineaceae bacterium SB0664_bin_27]|uniref:DUF2029 domain-containing protein n=1 Tax=Caldilineaceae bacterium SB0664_bin_27 TaxID=2605260 RepID=A0A6B0YPI6_9CHLR|nr:hypothetical protein [Caldilineaceae bacterium SB0664_bin_27]
MAGQRSWYVPIALTVFSLAAYTGMLSMQVRHGNLGTTQVSEFLIWFCLAFAAYATTIFWLERWWHDGSQENSSSRTGVRTFYLLVWIWGGGCLFRWLLLQTYPTLSSDVFRYMWDGYVTANGVSPYAYPINASQLDWLDTPFRAQANHAWMASPYLPAAQWFFAAIALFYPLDPISFQSAAVLFDLGTAFILSRLLVAVGLPAKRLLIYLWNPLVIVETAQGAHVDSLMVLLMMLAVYAMVRAGNSDSRASRTAHPELVEGKPAFSLVAPVFLALATLTKLIPALLLPVFWRRWNWGSRLLFVYLTLGMLVAPALRAGWGLAGDLDGRGLFGALRIYNEQWKFNSGLFRWLEDWLESMGIEGPMTQAQEIVYFLMFLLLLAVWWQFRQTEMDMRTTLRWLAVPLGGYLLLTTTVHPWYLLVLTPFLPFLAPAENEPKRLWLLALPWLWLSGIVSLSYVTYLDPENLRDLDWVRLLEWLPTLCLLGMALCWGIRRQGFARDLP